MCGPDLQLVLEQMSLLAARAASGLVPLHASAIDTDRGVIALAGSSGAGKSTLCAAAVMGGYPFVADEVTAVDPQNLAVRAFHRPIGLRQGAADALGVAHRLGEPGCESTIHAWDPRDHATTADGGTLAAIALVERTPGASHIEPVRASVAMVELLGHTVIPDEDLATAFHGLDRLVRVVPTFRLAYDTPDDGRAAIDRLLDQLDRPAR